MKKLKYYFKTQVFQGKVGIPSTLKDLVIRKGKENVMIDIVIITDLGIMTLTWNEIEFLSYETTSGKYSNYQHGSYQILWLDFVCGLDSIPNDDTMEEWKWELALLNKIHYSWYNPMRNFLIKDYKNIVKTIMQERTNNTIFPDQPDILKPFSIDMNRTRVVIVGQDPYPAGNHATGIAFATKQDKKPGSLHLIEKAIKLDYPEEKDIQLDSSMEHLIKQGVFLINTALTVKMNQANSHNELWKPFVDLVITILAMREKPIIFLLIGSEARRYKQQIESSNHTCICVEHPAAALHQNREWIYNKCFKEINNNLTIPIKWLKV